MSHDTRTIRRIAGPLAMVGVVMLLPQMPAVCAWPPVRLHDAVQLAADRAEAIADSIAAGAQQWMGSHAAATCPPGVVEVVSMDDHGVSLIAPGHDGSPPSGLSVDLHLTNLPPPA